MKSVFGNRNKSPRLPLTMGRGLLLFVAFLYMLIGLSVASAHPIAAVLTLTAGVGMLAVALARRPDRRRGGSDDERGR